MADPHAGRQFGRWVLLAIAISAAVLGAAVAVASWPLLDPRLRTFRGHTAPILSVAFSPDGARLVSTSGGIGRAGEVIVWDAATGQQLLTLRGHKSPFNSVAFSPDNERIAASNFDGTVAVWDADSGEQIHLLKKYTRGAYGVAFSPDGARLVATGDPRPPQIEGRYPLELTVWDTEGGQEMLAFEGNMGPAGTVTFSPDGRCLAGASSDGTVRMWDAESGQALLTFRGDTSQLHNAAFSPDGKRLATGFQGRNSQGRFVEGEVKVWDVQTGQEVLSFRTTTRFGDVVTFSPDGQRLATGGNDGRLRLWDASTGRQVLSVRVNGSITSVAFSPDGRRLATGGYGYTVAVWDVSDGK